MEELTLEANPDNLDRVLGFIYEKLDRVGCPGKARMQIGVAVEEMFINIASYAYAPETGPATLRIETIPESQAVRITFIDSGIPYDPLAKADPDITLSARERKIGGLGIFVVKKSMDDITYQRKEEKNILTILKKIG